MNTPDDPQNYTVAKAIDNPVAFHLINKHYCSHKSQQIA